MLGDPGAQRALGLALSLEQAPLAQQLEEGALALEVVLEAAVAILGAPFLLGALARIGADRGEAVLLERDADRPRDVALVLELSDGLGAAGHAGMAGHEHQVVFLRPGLADPEPALRLHGLAVLVYAEERHVEIV